MFRPGRGRFGAAKKEVTHCRVRGFCAGDTDAIANDNRLSRKLQRPQAVQQVPKQKVLKSLVLVYLYVLH
jgi:hypothetical protein